MITLVCRAGILTYSAPFVVQHMGVTYDNRKAKRLLSWEPQLDWRDSEQWEL